MRKLLKSKVLAVIGLAILAFTVSSLIPRHIGRTIACYEYRDQLNVKVKREQYGFPLILAKRSMSSTSCATYNIGYGDKANDGQGSIVIFSPDEHHEVLDNGYIIVTNLIGDVAFWLVLSYLGLTVYRRKQSPV